MAVTTSDSDMLSNGLNEDASPLISATILRVSLRIQLPKMYAKITTTEGLKEGSFSWTHTDRTIKSYQLISSSRLVKFSDSNCCWKEEARTGTCCSVYIQMFSKILYEGLMKKKIKYSYLESDVEEFINKNTIEFK